MLPGKTYTVDDVLSLVRRRAWLVVALVVLGSTAANAVYKRLPRWYRSETVIMLMPQRIPDAYVKPTSSDKLEDRLTTIEDQILSRSRLEHIILEQDLYQDLRDTQPIEALVVRMQKKEITIKVEGKESFRVSYIGRDPVTVQRVTARLASLFIEENLRDRGKQTQDTNDFLDSQLQDARRRLVEHEKKLEEYRREHSGQLPSQAASNLQAIQNLQMQLQALDAATDRATERRLLLERQIADVEAGAPGATAASAGGDATGAPVSTAAALEAARARLRDLLTHAKPDHPDVQAAQRTIRDLEAKQTAEATVAAPSDRRGEEGPSLAAAQRQNRTRELRAELDVVDQQVRARQAQEKHLRDEVAAYQAKLDSIPSRESDLDELTRDYRTLQATYEGLLVKREDAKLASDLERRNIGQQFKVLDPARVPEQPFSPNRKLVVAGGAGAGVALALLIIGLLEYRNDSFTREDEVVRLCQLPVLALVPTLTSVGERERARRRARAAIAATVALLLASAVAALAVWKGLLQVPRG